ncbi:hypothetical protein HGRIS_014685 [Hohenbuehelia grisea]|uniref:Uncharacterized protein n=1 Tax=Hohenbuehelia grisea TaxID=104357 RepID=A0ABR3JWF8_9AGAR
MNLRPGEYEAQDRATDNATSNFTKRRIIAGEIKQYKEQKCEAERYEALSQERREKKIKRAEKALDGKKPDLVATETQILHVTRKLNNTQKNRQDLLRDREPLQKKVDAPQAELVKTKHAADAAQAAQNETSRHNLALFEDSLEEYRRL